MKHKEYVRIVFALLMAMIISYFFAFSEKIWIPLATLVVMQGPIGSGIRRGLQLCLLLLIGILVFSFFFQKQLLYARVSDVLMGAMIGIITKTLLFPIQPDVLFREKVIPILQAYSDYLSSITTLALDNTATQANIARRHVEISLQDMPSWVYAPGFARTLQQGHRHFLVMIERIGQTLFSMHRAACYSFSPELRDAATEPLMHATEKSRQWLANMIDILLLKKSSDEIDDFDEDIVALETASQCFLPATIELMELSKEYLCFAALIYDLRDLRSTLLTLTEALRC